jgi:hypothetical protein
MADEFTWALSEIRAEFRRLIGRSSTDDISDTNCNKWINDYYVNRFPDDAQVDEFDSFFTQAASSTDNGEYTLNSGVERLDDPVTVNRTEIKLYRNREEFFSDYPEDEQFVTSPTLAIGTDDSTKVKHNAFTYRIQNYAYSKASSEVALSGSTVPQNKYGAWSLKIDEDGDITAEEADDNATGYDTPRLALEDLDQADGDSCFMGYVTVISTDSSGFIPGTTALSDSAVTDTYTDGKFETRNTPEAILLYGTKLYARPRPNDIYEIKAPTIANRPSAFSSDSSVPSDVKWGAMIALGAAMLYLSTVGESERITELTPRAKYLLDSIRSDKIKRLLGGQCERSF